MQNQSQNQGGMGGFLGNLGGFGDKLNAAAGGGREVRRTRIIWTKVCFHLLIPQSHKHKGKISLNNVSYGRNVRILTSQPGIDMFQEKILKQGPQDNESAIEQAKDEQISDMIRQQYKGITGKDIPIKDEPTTFG